MKENHMIKFSFMKSRQKRRLKLTSNNKNQRIKRKNREDEVIEEIIKD